MYLQYEKLRVHKNSPKTLLFPIPQILRGQKLLLRILIQSYQPSIYLNSYGSRLQKIKTIFFDIIKGITLKALNILEMGINYKRNDFKFLTLYRNHF